MAGEYLPPVITRLEGEIGDFLAMIAEAKAALASLADSEEKVSRAMEVKSAAAEVQIGRLEDLSRTLAITAGANDLMGVAEEDLGYKTTVVSVEVMRLNNELSDLGGRLAITAGEVTAQSGSMDQLGGAMGNAAGAAALLAGAEDRVKDSMGDKTRAAITQAGVLGAASAAARGAAGGFTFFGITLTGWLTLIHMWLVLFGAQTIADTIGIIAFGAAAIKNIGPVVQAVGNLTQQYQALDPMQRGAALYLDQFINSMKNANETGVFGVFYQGLALVKQAMSQGGGVTTQATQAFSDFFAMLQQDFKSPAWAAAFGSGAQIIRKDLDALFGLINQGINLIPALFHNFNDLGLGAIHMVSGFLGATRAVMEFNPSLTKAAAAATFAWGAYKILWSGLGRGPGILQRLATSMGVVIPAAAAQAVLGIGAFATAGAILIAVGANAMDSTGRQAQALVQLYQATGNNVTGYHQLIAAANEYIAQGHKLIGATGRQAEDIIYNFVRIKHQAQQSLANINTNLTHFSNLLGISKDKVLQYANATGVDLSQAMGKDSQAFAMAAAKIRAYNQAIVLSHHPLSVFQVDVNESRMAADSLSQQVQALSAAFQSFLGPLVNADQKTLILHSDIFSLKSALQASNNVVGVATQKQIASGLALTRAANDAIANSEAIKQATGSTRLAAGPLEFLIKQMEALHIHGSMARRILAELKAAEDALYNKSITVTIHTVQTGGGPPLIVAPGKPGAGGGPTSGAIPTSAVTASSQHPVEVHVHLDGREIYRTVQKHAVRRQKRTGNNGLQRITR